MDSSVLHILEYDKVRNLLADRTSCSIGREIAEQLVPVNNYVVVEQRLAETKEAKDIMAVSTNIPLGGIRDIRGIAKKAELGAILEPAELMSVGSTLYAVRRIKNFFKDLTIAAPLLDGLAGNLEVLHTIERIIENAINEHGIIRDDASVELLRIRREIRQSQNRVKEKLDSILRSADYQKFFQDALVTIRGDRYVIPVKQEYRHNFPGIVHDQSASGATVFIEPMAVVNLNNDVKQLTAAEKNEIERILHAISAQIAKVVQPIYSNCQILGQLDFAFAKARLSFDMKAELPMLNPNGRIHLLRARHPLITSERIVPIDVYMGKDFNTLLITGPNTGGKTVTLKTLGLFALMTQAGLFIPAASGSEVSVFNNVFADIGDEQSIEQSLSTFSGHMTNLVKILERVSSQDLVLIDEIGAGTDPEEGAALAMAILEYLLNIGAKTVATTHYSELKTFAYSKPGIENASVEFDIQTLRPTYRLLIGVPGSSNAFSISSRLGLSDLVIERAKQLITKEHAQLEHVLAELEEQKLVYEQRNEEIKAKENEIALLQKELNSERFTMVTKRDQILTKAQRDAEGVLRNARREAEAVIAELKAQFSAKNTKDRQQAIDQARRRLQDGLDGCTIEQDSTDLLIPATPDSIKPGSNVYITSLQQKGTVLLVDNKDVTVQIGALKVNVPIRVCQLTSEPIETATKATKLKMNFTKVQDVARQIDVRGMTVEEGEVVLAKYLDDAVLAGLNQVLVIHGKGTGALRKGIRAYLKNHHHVKDISIGEVNEGGDGATVVRLL